MPPVYAVVIPISRWLSNYHEISGLWACLMLVVSLVTALFLMVFFLWCYVLLSLYLVQREDVSATFVNWLTDTGWIERFVCSLGDKVGGGECLECSRLGME